jgi:hypothetical protein
MICQTPDQGSIKRHSVPINDSNNMDEGPIIIMMYRLPGISLAEFQHGNGIRSGGLPSLPAGVAKVSVHVLYDVFTA